MLGFSPLGLAPVQCTVEGSKSFKTTDSGQHRRLDRLIANRGSYPSAVYLCLYVYVDCLQSVGTRSSELYGLFSEKISVYLPAMSYARWIGWSSPNWSQILTMACWSGDGEANP